MTPARRQQIETRWKEIDAKLETVRLTSKSPIEGVDAEFYRGQLLEELDKMEFELGRADFVSYNTIMETRRPTREAYGELSKAYDFYNRALFGNRLPQCLITLQRKKSTYGFFSGDRWASANDTADEIALNPSHFAKRDTEQILSTLVHEMTHLEQHHFGKPGRGRYHNQAWGLLMDRVGLCPTDTGKPGGKRTGDRITHYIEAGGRFDLATQKLLATGFELSWIDRASAGRSSSTTPTKTREKYSCPSCDLNAWAKPGVSLTCTDCEREFEITQ